MINIDTLIFDVDGTLVDSRKDIVNAINFTTDSLKLKRRSAADIISYVGWGVEDLVRKTLGEKDERFFDKALILYIDYFLNHPADESKLYPHVKETLEYFKDKDMFVMSNRRTSSAVATVTKLGIAKYFKKVLGADEEKCRKPSLCSLEKDEITLRINKIKTIMIGDMDIDIKTGKEGGMKTCWVSYGLGKRADVEPLKPDFIIDDFAELRKIIR